MLLQSPHRPSTLTLGWDVRGEGTWCLWVPETHVRHRTKHPSFSGQGPASSSHLFLNKQSPIVMDWSQERVDQLFSLLGRRPRDGRGLARDRA